ncbi:hypothetical protein [Pseudomonas shirazensis]|uniref:hypothetical protein n=1 Tax=Pseudomonas shirazensis TaxID=2745494 RepID=UPI001646D55C|nr:hypothetical protein [Pseudomonas shirazensis]MBV4503174.1 hypothetical protein [Pseudomonas shirazensis]
MAQAPTYSEWLGEFSIELSSHSACVHNNTRQQVAVNVYATPLEGELSDSEFASLHIVVQNSEGGYDPLPEEHVTAPWYFTTTRDERFDYFPVLVPPALPELAIPPELEGMEIQLESSPREMHPRSRQKQLYVHSRAPGGSKIQLRACITRDNGKTYWTDEVGADIELYAHPTPTYLFPEDYQLTTPSERPQEADSVIQEYILTPGSGAFSCAESDSGDSNGFIQLQGDPSCSTSDAPPRLTARFDPNNPGHIAIRLQHEDHTPSSKEPGGQQPAWRLCVYDRQGNRHPFSIELDDGQDGDHPGFRLISSHCAQENPVVPQAVANIAFFQVKGLGLAENNTRCPLYNNTYQTTYVDVVIRAVNDNQEPVNLTASQLNSIELVSYDTGARLANGYSWYISASKRSPDDLFDPYPASLPAEQSAPSQDDQSIRIWIKTSSAVNVQVAARLILDGVTYHTYFKAGKVGGETESGKSNSSATIVPYPQNYTIPAGEFEYTRSNHQSGDDYDIDLYKLKISDSRYQIRSSSSSDYIFAKDNVGFTIFNEQICFRRDHSRKAIVFALGQFFLIQVNNTAGIAYAARLKVYGFGQESEIDKGLRVFYRDQYGNGHPLWIRAQRGTDANMLEWIDAKS